MFVVAVVVHLQMISGSINEHLLYWNHVKSMMSDTRLLFLLIFIFFCISVFSAWSVWMVNRAEIEVGLDI